MVLRILLLTGWLLIPVVGYALHMGPGQDQVRLDESSRAIRTAEAAAANEDYAAAVAAYEQALQKLPSGRTAEARKLRLEKAKSQMLAKQLPEANADLKLLVDELSADTAADPRLLADAQSALANSQYYLTWLMRLEGHGRDVWEPEVEAARQTYKMLAEQALIKGDSATAKKHNEDLESSIRLARMDLEELQGLPLPSQ